MSDPEAVRRGVSADYARAVTSPKTDCCGGGGAVDPALVRSWAGRLTGKIASIKIRAHKPE